MATTLNGDAWTPRRRRLAARLDRALRARIGEANGDVSLEVACERADGDQLEVKLAVRDGAASTVMVHDRHEDGAVALRMVFDAAIRELEMDRDTARAEAAARPAPIDDALRARLIDEVLPAAARIAHHELALRQLAHEIPFAWLDPHDLIDEALAEVLGEAGPRSGPELVERIGETIRARLDAAIASLGGADGQDRVSLEGDAEARDVDGVSPLWDDLKDFWVIGQSLRVEDTLPDAAAKDPEAVVASKETRHALVTALFDLPYDVRWIFGRVVSDGVDPADVAAATDLDEAVVRDRVERASARLAARLFAGGDGDASAVRELYRELGGTIVDLARRV